MQATMSLLGMYNYDNSILDLLALPEDLDSDLVKNNLLMETAELELLYSNFGFMRQAIGSWSNKQLPIWEELYATTKYEYNPIWNKDGTIEETIERDLATTDDLTITDDLTDEQTRDATDEQTRDLATTNDNTTTGYVYGFNSTSDAASEKSIVDQDTTDTGSITDTHTGTITDTHTGTITDTHTGTITDTHTGTRTHDRDTTDTGTITTTRTEQGNIGLTSTQELIRQQRDVVQFNIIDIIINDFIDRFCLRIY